MNLTVTAGAVSPINLRPATLTEEVVRNVALLLRTPQYSVPLDRGFGLSQTFLDAPLPVAKTRFAAEVLDAIQTYEPRAEVVSVTFEEDGVPGRLRPVVEIKIQEGGGGS